MRGDGDGWVRCAVGHRHWGLFGAAGLLLRDGTRSILQHRAPWTHQGDTWGLPGGAIDSHEDAVTASLRESGEEAGIDPAHVRPIGFYVDDHGGWSYTTVIAEPVGDVTPHAANGESIDVRWWSDDQIAALPLHTGFADAWQTLRAAPRPVSIVVDWNSLWREGWTAARASTPRTLREDLYRVVTSGIDVTHLPVPARVAAVGLHRVVPRVIIVSDPSVGYGDHNVAADNQMIQSAVGVRYPGYPVECHDVLALTAGLRAAGEAVVVVTADQQMAGDADSVTGDWLVPLFS